MLRKSDLQLNNGRAVCSVLLDKNPMALRGGWSAYVFRVHLNTCFKNLQFGFIVDNNSASLQTCT